jgi:hypothetical protein
VINNVIIGDWTCGILCNLNYDYIHVNLYVLMHALTSLSVSSPYVPLVVWVAVLWMDIFVVVK